MHKILIIAAGLVFTAAAQAADPAAGKEKSKVCAACHGANGISVSDTIPNLAAGKCD